MDVLTFKKSRAKKLQAFVSREVGNSIAVFCYENYLEQRSTALFAFWDLLLKIVMVGIRLNCIRFVIQVFICSFKKGTRKFEPECNCLYYSRLVHHVCESCVAQNIYVDYYVHSCCIGFNAKDRVGFRKS